MRDSDNTDDKNILLVAGCDTLFALCNSLLVQLTYTAGPE